MSDNNAGSLTVKLVTNCMNDLAHELGVMDPDDPSESVNEFLLSHVLEHRVTVLENFPYKPAQASRQNSRVSRSRSNAWTSLLVGWQRSNRDPRRKQIVDEIMRLRNKTEENK